MKLVEFYESNVGQAIYSLRSISIEPLIEHIKSVFRIDPLPVRGYAKASSVVLLSVLLYQILIYYNCKTKKDNPVSNIALNNSIAYTDKKDIISLLLEQNDSNLYDINNKDDL